MTRTEHIHDNECPNCMMGGPGQCDACIANVDLIAKLEADLAVAIHCYSCNCDGYEGHREPKGA